MLFHGIELAVAALIGFGIGRIKNAALLAKIEAELKSAESSVDADVKALVAKLKSLF